MNCSPEGVPDSSALAVCEHCGHRFLTAPIEARQCSAQVTLEHFHGGNVSIDILTDHQRASVVNETQVYSHMTAEEFRRIFPVVDDPKLIGAQLKELFSAIGFPPCAGCDNRAAWLDSAHALALKLFWRK